MSKQKEGQMPHAVGEQVSVGTDVHVCRVHASLEIGDPQLPIVLEPHNDWWYRHENT